ncbi:hypothetical protein HK101_007886 [Irineochytrium annulatum]|nr:hypothetical protein HK101_007886 [Irineochytrium annulatum]
MLTSLSDVLPYEIIAQLSVHLHPHDVRRLEIVAVRSTDPASRDRDGSTRGGHCRPLRLPASLTVDPNFALLNLRSHIAAYAGGILLRCPINLDRVAFDRGCLGRVHLHRLGACYLAAAIRIDPTLDVAFLRAPSEIGEKAGRVALGHAFRIVHERSPTAFALSAAVREWACEVDDVGLLEAWWGNRERRVPTPDWDVERERLAALVDKCVRSGSAVALRFLMVELDVRFEERQLVEACRTGWRDVVMVALSAPWDRAVLNKCLMEGALSGRGDWFEGKAGLIRTLCGAPGVPADCGKALSKAFETGSAEIAGEMMEVAKERMTGADVAEWLARWLALEKRIPSTGKRAHGRSHLQLVRLALRSTMEIAPQRLQADPLGALSLALPCRDPSLVAALLSTASEQESSAQICQWLEDQLFRLDGNIDVDTHLLVVGFLDGQFHLDECRVRRLLVSTATEGQLATFHGLLGRYGALLFSDANLRLQVLQALLSPCFACAFPDSDGDSDVLPGWDRAWIARDIVLASPAISAKDAFTLSRAAYGSFFIAGMSALDALGLLDARVMLDADVSWCCFGCPSNRKSSRRSVVERRLDLHVYESFLYLLNRLLTSMTTATGCGCGPEMMTQAGVQHVACSASHAIGRQRSRLAELECGSRGLFLASVRRALMNAPGVDVGWVTPWLPDVAAWVRAELSGDRGVDVTAVYPPFRVGSAHREVYTLACQAACEEVVGALLERRLLALGDGVLEEAVSRPGIFRIVLAAVLKCSRFFGERGRRGLFCAAEKAVAAGDMASLDAVLRSGRLGSWEAEKEKWEQLLRLAVGNRVAIGLIVHYGREAMVGSVIRV